MYQAKYKLTFRETASRTTRLQTSSSLTINSFEYSQIPLHLAPPLLKTSKMSKIYNVILFYFEITYSI